MTSIIFCAGGGKTTLYIRSGKINEKCPNIIMKMSRITGVTIKPLYQRGWGWSIMFFWSRKNKPWRHEDTVCNLAKHLSICFLSKSCLGLLFGAGSHPDIKCQRGRIWIWQVLQPSFDNKQLFYTVTDSFNISLKLFFHTAISFTFSV